MARRGASSHLFFFLEKASTASTVHGRSSSATSRQLIGCCRSLATSSWLWTPRRTRDSKCTLTGHSRQNPTVSFPLSAGSIVCIRLQLLECCRKQIGLDRSSLSFTSMESFASTPLCLVHSSIRIKGREPLFSAPSNAPSMQYLQRFASTCPSLNWRCESAVIGHFFRNYLAITACRKPQHHRSLNEILALLMLYGLQEQCYPTPNGQRRHSQVGLSHLAAAFEVNLRSTHLSLVKLTVSRHHKQPLRRCIYFRNLRCLQRKRY